MRLRKKRNSGQAILEYILMTIMLAVTMAVTIRGVNQGIYTFWTALTLGVANACADCTYPINQVPQKP